MSVTFERALTHLNLRDGHDEELALFVDAANEWVAARVTDTTPAPVQLATLYLIDHWWDSKRGPSASPLTDNDLVEFGGPGFAIPNRVRELLGPHLSLSTPTGSDSFPAVAGWPDPAVWP